MALQRVATALERSRRGLYFRGAAYRRGRKDYLIVSGPGGDARRYRCDHQAEQLRIAGASADVGYHDELDLESLASRYRTIVLYRVPWDAKVERALSAARTRGTRVLADIDDLVFDRAKIRLIDGIVRQGPEAVRAAEERADALSRTLEAVDGVVVSTRPLDDAVFRLNRNVAVAHNAVSRKMVHLAERALRGVERESDETVIAYLSGTATHDRDFAEAAEAILRALERSPRVRFWVIGFLRLDERFDPYGHRVFRIPYQPWRRLNGLLARVDVSLAPLEAGNEFTNAKSCLKYLEAALLGVPTVATPTHDFRRVIRDGENGLLAADDAAWRHALDRLLDEADDRRAVGEAARRDVLATHTTNARAFKTARAYATAATLAD